MAETSESKWKKTPVTVGLLISLAGSIYYGSGYIDVREHEAVEGVVRQMEAKHEQELINLRIEHILERQEYERERTDRKYDRIELDLGALTATTFQHIEEFDERIDELEQQ